MERKGRAILALGILGVAATAFADSRNATEFDSISNRNAFGLRDAPPAPAPLYTNAPVAQTNKEDFYLTGISTIGAPKRPKAYLVAKDSQKKDYDQRYYNLGVGDRQGDLTLKQIDEKGRRVLIEYQGEDKWLTMRENGVPSPSAVAGTNSGVIGTPGHPPQQAMISPPPLPAGASNAIASAPSPSLPSYPKTANRRPAHGSNFGNPGMAASGSANSSQDIPGLARLGPATPTISPGVTISNPDIPPSQGSATFENSDPTVPLPPNPNSAP
jgi:hypothetical protein